MVILQNINGIVSGTVGEKQKMKILKEKHSEESSTKKVVAFTVYTTVEVADQIDNLYHKMRLQRKTGRITKSAIISMAIEKAFEQIKTAPKGVERRKTNLFLYDMVIK